MNDGYETLIITFSEPIEVLDGRFEDIDTWGVDSLKKYAADLKLDTAAFNKCLDSGEKAAQVKADMEAGQKAGPAMMVALIVPGSPPCSQSRSVRLG